jgi:maltooligosyltrehalose trehalohydrolase
MVRRRAAASDPCPTSRMTDTQQLSDSRAAVDDAAGAPWSLRRGARLVDGGVHFSVWAPNAERVAVRLFDGEGRTVAEHRLAPAPGGADAPGAGVYEAVVDGVGAGGDYAFVLDGGVPVPDPVSRWQPGGVHAPSRVVDPDAFRWSDAGWAGLSSMADYVIYELHVGTFSDEGTFDGAIPHLADLKALGVTAIELMPVAEFPGDRNWGYDGVYPYAPESGYGGPDGLKRLVDAAHGVGLAVVLDVVYNHLGPEGNYLGMFGPYFTDVYRTPWGPAVNYDGPGSDEVRRYVIDNALYWVTEYHVDALRLDAIHGIYDVSAEHVLAELTRRVHEQAAALVRRVHLIAESDLNDPRVIRPVEEYGFGFDAQWSDDFHHAVHSALTGETTGYYADFGGAEPVITALGDPFVYGGRYSPHRRRRHGGPAGALPRDRFVVCIQNHDQVGNRAAGERLGALVSFAEQKLAASLLLLSPYVPLLFMGEEYGETNPFLYFISHGDEELAEAVRSGRREEFASFGWGADVPDPQAEGTFRRSKLDRSKLAHPAHAAIRALYGDLLRLRREHPALRPGGATIDVDGDAEAGTVAVTLTPGRGGRTLLALFNLGGEERRVRLPAPVGGWSGEWSSERREYGGAGEPANRIDEDAERRGGRYAVLAPYAAELYSQETP